MRRTTLNGQFPEGDRVFFVGARVIVVTDFLNAAMTAQGGGAQVDDDKDDLRTAAIIVGTMAGAYIGGEETGLEAERILQGPLGSLGIALLDQGFTAAQVGLRQIRITLQGLIEAFESPRRVSGPPVQVTQRHVDLHRVGVAAQRGVSCSVRRRTS